MPKVIKTTGDRGLDAEIDRLHKRISDLEAASSASSSKSVTITTKTENQGSTNHTTVVGANWRIVIG